MARESGDRLLLSVGVFEACAPLEHAIAELHGEGFSAREMCLVGTADAFAEMVKRPARPLLPRNGRPLYQRQRHHLPWLSDEIHVLATSGILLSTLTVQAAAERDRRVASSACLTQELSSKLCEHLERDAIALLVTASDHVHQNQGARVLLRHSFHPVQTYAVRSAVLAGH